MKILLRLIVATLTAFLPSKLSYSQSLWITAYYAGWMQSNSGNDNGWLPSDSVDYNALTHIFHFALEPTSSGGNLDSLGNSLYHYNSRRVIQRAHAAGKKILVTIGGWATNTNFMSATSNTNRANFIRRLMDYVTQFGYDGIDIDWEPIEDTEVSRFQLFIQQLRDSMNARNPNLLLAAATAWQPQMWGNIHQYFDQINLMTYDLSGPWPDWVAWHNAPIYDGNFQFPCCPGVYVPSADRMIDEWIAAGVPRAKLGIGIDFYGYIWYGGTGTPTGGVTAPRQPWLTSPTVIDNVPYYDIHKLITPTTYRWDDTARAAYLSIDRPGAAADSFISFDNELATFYKLQYVRTKGIGGIIIWELGGGYFSRSQFPIWQGRRDPLLQAVKNAVASIAVLLSAGWNMIANPVNTSNDSVRQLYPASLYPYAFTYVQNNGYVQDFRLRNGRGYWGKFPSAHANILPGNVLPLDSIDVHEGWNLIGSISCTIDTSSIVTIPPGIRISNWFGYDREYFAVSQFNPGKSYWVKVAQEGKIVLTCNDRSVVERLEFTEKQRNR